jgi:catechol 2,3-dioxygenase-like lactoylglutathione lyase family enzyme
MATTKIKLVRIAHVFYKHKNIEAARQFYVDFGFVECARDEAKKRTYYRGYGTEPFVLCAEEADVDEFAGPAFVVESEDDLEYAAKTLPKATAIYELDTPGGGKCVTFYDPVDGFPFHLIFGQKPIEVPGPEFTKVVSNYVSNASSWAKIVLIIK